eukprot:TRINITY_DN16649_c0_g1_i2.p1 TRINITY_DN16649_c0_g1~~TRINITY_DN16649_c0_g1_i2.p1  ORF type:complete len:144 (+),score=30.91 TRINITY_DN16649_c0_g1_i2:96-527(+)
MIRRPPRSTLSSSSAASDVYKRQVKDDPRILYLSLHRAGAGFYPETAQDLEVSDDVVNVPLGPGVKSKGYLQKFDQFVVPAIEKFAPSLILILSLIHISEPTRLLSISYAVFCLKKKKTYLYNTLQLYKINQYYNSYLQPSHK